MGLGPINNCHHRQALAVATAADADARCGYTIIDLPKLTIVTLAVHYETLNSS